MTLDPEQQAAEVQAAQELKAVLRTEIRATRKALIRTLKKLA